MSTGKVKQFYNFQDYTQHFTTSAAPGQSVIIFMEERKIKKTHWS